MPIEKENEKGMKKDSYLRINDNLPKKYIFK